MNKLQNLREKINKLETKIEKPKKIDYNKISSSNVALELFISVTFCGFLGWFLDNYFTTRPILFILLVLIGILSGFRNIFRKL